MAGRKGRGGQLNVVLVDDVCDVLQGVAALHETGEYDSRGCGNRLNPRRLRTITA